MPVSGCGREPALECELQRASWGEELVLAGEKVSAKCF